MVTGQELKGQGQQQALRAETEAWKTRALELLEEFARKNARFNADQFRAWAVPAIGEPHHPNVWGALYTVGARRFWIRRTSDYAQSANPAAHAHHYVWWESLLVDREAPVPAPSAMRYEMKAPTKPGMTFSSLANAKAAVYFYCKTFRVKPAALVFRELVPGSDKMPEK